MKWKRKIFHSARAKFCPNWLARTNFCYGRAREEFNKFPPLSLALPTETLPLIGRFWGRLEKEQDDG
jgi:hypothetical protein